MSSISEKMVNDAQQVWCHGLVRIGDVAAEGGDVRTSAGDLVDALHDYAQGMVFFKPTLAYGKNSFRSSRRGAISCFVGGDPDLLEDTGFALRRWVKVWYDITPPRTASRFMVTSRSPWATCICRTQLVTRLWWTRRLFSASAMMANCVFACTSRLYPTRRIANAARC